MPKCGSETRNPRETAAVGYITNLREAKNNKHVAHTFERDVIKNVLALYSQRLHAAGAVAGLIHTDHRGCNFRARDVNVIIEGIPMGDSLSVSSESTMDVGTGEQREQLLPQILARESKP